MFSFMDWLASYIACLYGVYIILSDKWIYQQYKLYPSRVKDIEVEIE